MITKDFQVYHGLVEEMKRRGLSFISLRPGEPVPSNVQVVITTPQDIGDIRFDRVILADTSSLDDVVERALHILRGRHRYEELVIGVDPGKHPGIAVLADGKVVAVYHVSVSEVHEVIRDMVRSNPSLEVIVRVGHGARLVRSQIVNTLLEEGVRVELVDENGTSPFLGRGVRGKTVSDIVAAINIANTPGSPVGRQRVEPSAGEIRVIQEQSREHSRGRATIPRYLARRVAKGELTLDEAFAEHANGH